MICTRSGRPIGEDEEPTPVDVFSTSGPGTTIYVHKAPCRQSPTQTSPQAPSSGCAADRAGSGTTAAPVRPPSGAATSPSPEHSPVAGGGPSAPVDRGLPLHLARLWHAVGTIVSSRTTGWKIIEV
jgi:hypothetical protein